MCACVHAHCVCFGIRHLPSPYAHYVLGQFRITVHPHGLSSPNHSSLLLLLQESHPQFDIHHYGQQVVEGLDTGGEDSSECNCSNTMLKHKRLLPCAKR